MSTDTRSLGRRWLDFWFAAADPTTLGFMRIITGVLVIYIHLVYSLDLQSFFGRDGWYGLAEVNSERKEYPYTLPSFWKWDDEEITIPAYVPEYPHRRKAAMEWYRKLADMPKAERDRALAYADRLLAIPSLTATSEGFQFAERIPQNPLVQKNRLDMIVDPNLRTLTDRIPAFIEQMKDDDRVRLRDDLAAFLASLPTDANNRQYVLNHLAEINHRQCTLLMKFLHDLPDDKAERDRQLAYLQKWNNEARKALNVGFPIFSIWFHISDPTEMAIAHAVILGIMVLFTLGLFTPVTSVLTWLAAVSYIHRTQQILFGMDTMMNLLLIYLMIGPSGAAMSLDRWRAKRKLTGNTSEAAKRFLAAPPKSRRAGFALRLIQIHFCFIYFAAGLSKLKGPAWWNHNAAWDTIANPEFTMIHFRFYEAIVSFIAEHRPIYSFVAAGTVLFTFIMELCLPFLVWTRLRPWMVIGGVLFHFGIGAFMGLNIFALLMMTLLLSYLPGSVIREQLFGRTTNGASSRV